MKWKGKRYNDIDLNADMIFRQTLTQTDKWSDQFINIRSKR